MADIPDGLVLKHHRDLEGLRESLWPRRLLVALQPDVSDARLRQ